jgi:hypothetical protein
LESFAQLAVIFFSLHLGVATAGLGAARMSTPVVKVGPELAKAKMEINMDAIASLLITQLSCKYSQDAP